MVCRPGLHGWMLLEQQLLCKVLVSGTLHRQHPTQNCNTRTCWILHTYNTQVQNVVST